MVPEPFQFFQNSTKIFLCDTTEMFCGPHKSPNVEQSGESNDLNFLYIYIFFPCTVLVKKQAELLHVV